LPPAAHRHGVSVAGTPSVSQRSRPSDRQDDTLCPRRSHNRRRRYDRGPQPGVAKLADARDL